MAAAEVERTAIEGGKGEDAEALLDELIARAGRRDDARNRLRVRSRAGERVDRDRARDARGGAPSDRTGKRERVRAELAEDEGCRGVGEDDRVGDRDRGRTAERGACSADQQVAGAERRAYVKDESASLKVDAGRAGDAEGVDATELQVARAGLGEAARVDGRLQDGRDVESGRIRREDRAARGAVGRDRVDGNRANAGTDFDVTGGDDRGGGRIARVGRDAARQGQDAARGRDIRGVTAAAVEGQSRQADCGRQRERRAAVERHRLRSDDTAGHLGERAAVDRDADAARRGGQRAGRADGQVDAADDRAAGERVRAEERDDARRGVATAEGDEAQRRGAIVLQDRVDRKGRRSRRVLIEKEEVVRARTVGKTGGDMARIGRRTEGGGTARTVDHVLHEQATRSQDELVRRRPESEHVVRRRRGVEEVERVDRGGAGRSRRAGGQTHVLRRGRAREGDRVVTREAGGVKGADAIGGVIAGELDGIVGEVVRRHHRPATEEVVRERRGRRDQDVLAAAVVGGGTLYAQRAVTRTGIILGEIDRGTGRGVARQAAQGERRSLLVALGVGADRRGDDRDALIQGDGAEGFGGVGILTSEQAQRGAAERYRRGVVDAVVDAGEAGVIQLQRGVIDRQGARAGQGAEIVQYRRALIKERGAAVGVVLVEGQRPVIDEIKGGSRDAAGETAAARGHEGRGAVVGGNGAADDGRPLGAAGVVQRADQLDVTVEVERAAIVDDEGRARGADTDGDRVRPVGEFKRALVDLDRACIRRLGRERENAGAGLGKTRGAGDRAADRRDRGSRRRGRGDLEFGAARGEDTAREARVAILGEQAAAAQRQRGHRIKRDRAAGGEVQGVKRERAAERGGSAEHDVFGRAKVQGRDRFRSR